MFDFLAAKPVTKTEVGPGLLEGNEVPGIVIRKAIDSPVRCNICGARLHLKSISIDHDVRKEDGGAGNLENAQPTHPFCNTGYKERKTALAAKQSGA